MNREKYLEKNEICREEVYELIESMECSFYQDIFYTILGELLKKKFNFINILDVFKLINFYMDKNNLVHKDKK